MEIVQVEGFYVSSSLPKALFLPITSHRSSKKKHIDSSDLYYKAKKKNAELKKISTINQEVTPVPGRQHLSVQTDLYLEELCEVVEEADAQCETDPLLDRPPSPLFVPAKIGVDVATQIESGELFDFDEEVEPLLEALIGQSLEQAVIEVAAEEEIAAITDLQNCYEVKRNSELAELKRLEERERRLLEEKQKRLKEQEKAIILEEEVAEKMAACLFSQNYLEDLIPQVYEKLETEGYFETEDPESKEVEENFWPWLLGEVDAEISTLEASCQLLDSLIEDSVEKIATTSVISPNIDLMNKPDATNEETLITPDIEQNVDLVPQNPEEMLEATLESSDPEPDI